MPEADTRERTDSFTGKEQSMLPQELTGPVFIWPLTGDAQLRGSHVPRHLLL